MNKSRKQKLQAFRTREGLKNNRRAKEVKYRKAVLQFMYDHNKVKYRVLPGMPGKYPYQLTPITFEEAERLMRGGDKIKMVKITLTGGEVSKVVNEEGVEVSYEVETVNPLSAAADETQPSETPAEAPAEETPAETPAEETGTQEAAPAAEETPAADAAPSEPAAETPAEGETPAVSEEASPEGAPADAAPSEPAA